MLAIDVTQQILSVSNTEHGRARISNWTREAFHASLPHVCRHCSFGCVSNMRRWDKTELEIRFVVRDSRDGRSVATSAAAQTITNPRRDGAIREGRRVVESLMSLSAIPGMSVAVAVDGRLVWSEGFGMADLEHPAQVTTATRFRLASTSKILTASMAARLAQEGRLDLDAPIRRYLPDLPFWGDSVTSRLLLGHLGGIRGYNENDQRPCCNIDRRHYATTSDALMLFVDDPLVAHPGAEYHYSTFGYTLLSAVIEAACGDSFLACLDRSLLRPLELSRTSADRQEIVIPDRSEFFDRDRDGIFRHAEYVDPSYKWAGGGLLSTAEDLVRFGAAHLVSGFFDERTLNALFTSQTTTGGDTIGVGLGWRIGHDDDGHRLAWHAGNMAGARSVLLIDRDRQGIVAMLSNTRLGPYFVEATAQALLEPFLDPERVATSEAAENAYADGSECALCGTYEYRFEAGEEGEADRGTLRMDRRGPLFGTMTLPASIAAIEQAGVPAPVCVPVVDLEISHRQAMVVVVTSAGVLTLQLRPTETGFEGASIGLFTERSITGTKTDAPACALEGSQ